MTAAPPRAGRPLGRASMIARVKALARRRGSRTLSRRDLESATGIGYLQMIRHFNSHTALMEACGLEARKRRPSVSDGALLIAMHETFTGAGGILDWQRFDRACCHRQQTYKNRWGSWTAALRAYREWVQVHHPEFLHLAELAMRCQPHGGRLKGPVAWHGCGGPRLGAPLNLNGLQHAPTNEMGVVFLFGLLAPSLGYLVESLSTGFPDCAAKRRLHGPDQPWERVRIEFEFRSRNFLTHKHDPRKCDLIVCWKNDWPDCPLEVLELKREIERFGERGKIARAAGSARPSRLSRTGRTWPCRRTSRSAAGAARKSPSRRWPSSRRP